jgi:hypothetical protein
MPRSPAEPDGQAALVEEVADRALAGEFGPVACLEAPEPVPVPVSLRRADGRSVYQRHGGVKYATRVQLSREEKLASQAGARKAPAMSAQETARSLGTTIEELTAALHDPPGAEIKTTDFRLRMDQAAAAFHVLTSGRRVEVIVGPAGSGKTRVLARSARPGRGAGWSGSRRRSHPATCSPPRGWPRATTSPNSSAT